MSFYLSLWLVRVKELHQCIFKLTSEYVKSTIKRYLLDTKNVAHSGPELEAGFEKKNCSKVWHIFLEHKLYDNSKMVCWKILALGIPELTLWNDPKNLQNVSHGDGTSKKIFMSPPTFFSWKIDAFLKPFLGVTIKVFPSTLISIVNKCLKRVLLIHPIPVEWMSFCHIPAVFPLFEAWFSLWIRATRWE